MLSGASTPDEAVHGFGAQTRWNLKGRMVPVLTREQGVGRGDPLITEAQNALTPPQGGDEASTYAVVPQYLTSRNRGMFLTDAQYSAFDLRPAGRSARSCGRARCTRRSFAATRRRS